MLSTIKPLARVSLLSVLGVFPVHATSVATLDVTLSAVIGVDATDNPATLRDDTGLSLDDSHSLIGLSAKSTTPTGLGIGGRVELAIRADDGEFGAESGLAFLSVDTRVGQVRFGRLDAVYRTASEHPWRFDDSSSQWGASRHYVSNAIAWQREWALWNLAVLAAFEGGISRQQATLAYTLDRGELRIGFDNQSERLSSTGQALDTLSSMTVGGSWDVGGDIRVIAAATHFDMSEMERATLVAAQPNNDASSAFGSLVVAEYERNGNTFSVGYENGNWERDDDERFVFELQRGLSAASTVWLAVNAADDGSAFRLGMQYDW